jgi:hypothetical protein
MQSTRYQQLNPLALAVAAGCTELISALLISFPMMGMMGQARSYAGFAITWWIGGAVLSALAGAIFAWVYNAVNASSETAAMLGNPVLVQCRPFDSQKGELRRATASAAR